MAADPAGAAVLVIGDVMLDVVAAPRGPIEIGADTPAAITLLPGGSGANQAAWLGYLGVRARFAGRAGSDGHAWHTAALRAHGVEPHIARDTACRTGVLVDIVSADGERSFLTDRGANANLERGDLPDALLDGVALVHVSAYALAAEASRGAVLALLVSAARRAIPFTVDPGAVSLVRDLGPAAFREWTRAAAVCFPNAAEAAVLSGAPGGADPRDALARLAPHYETVVVKVGAAGALAASEFGRRQWAVSAPPVTLPLDTTGAGDAFVAGFLAARLRGADVEACLARGVAAGAQAISRFGGRPPAS